VLQQLDAVLNHCVEGRGANRSRVLDHLAAQINKRDDDAQRADELAQISESLQREHTFCSDRLWVHPQKTTP
jgi:hypothetical protein